jgi:hypothetical protein
LTWNLVAFMALTDSRDVMEASSEFLESTRAIEIPSPPRMPSGRPQTFAQVTEGLSCRDREDYPKRPQDNAKAARRDHKGGLDPAFAPHGRHPTKDPAGERCS